MKLSYTILNFLILIGCLAYITTTLHITVIQAVLVWLAIGFATGAWENLWKILAEYINTHIKNKQD